MASKRLAGLVLAATIVLSTGCGGSSSKSSAASSSGGQSSSDAPAGSSPATTTAASASTQFAAAAGAICQRLSTQSAKVTFKTLQDLARTTPRLVAYQRAALVELRKLTPPAGLAGDWKTILADLRTITRETAAMGRYAQQHDGVSVARVNANLGTIQHSRVVIAARDHITGCTSI